MKAKKLAFAVSLAVGLGAAATSANAIQQWSFQDDDIDFLYRGSSVINPATCVGTDCLIQKGDILISVFEYPTFTIDGKNAIPTGKEVTGVSAIQLYDINTTGLGPVLSFGAVAAGLNSILQLGIPGLTVTGGAAGESGMIATFINNATSTSGTDRNLNLDIATAWATNCTGLTDCIGEASQGSLLQVDGGIFADGTKLDPDNYWRASPTIEALTGSINILDISAVHKVSPNTNVVGVNAGLSVLWNSVLPIYPQTVLGGVPSATCTGGADGCVEFGLQANITGGGSPGTTTNPGLSNGAFAHSTTISSTKYVPEPGSIALLGAAMLGLGATRRRKS